MAKKTYVLDTNVLLDDIKVFDKFPNSDLVIPFIVLEELDKHKTAKGELGANARNIIRQLDALSDAGDLLKGVSVGNKTNVYVSSWTAGCDTQLNKNKLVDMPDNRILATALAVKANKRSAVLVSNDVSLRIKSKSFNLETQSHVSEIRPDSVDDIYSGIMDFNVPCEVVDELHAMGETAIPENLNFFPNEYVHFVDNTNEKHTGIGSFVKGKIVKSVIPKVIGGIKPRNVRQAVAFDALLNDDITLVTLLGKAGCGKTLISLAAGVERVFERDPVYEKIILIRPVSHTGDELGFMPGSLNEKFFIYCGNFFDNLLILFPSYKDKEPGSLVEFLMSSGKLEIAPPTYMRGRSLAKAFIIVDEVQNMNIHEIKTIATRLGEGSKLVVMGDLNQIDNPKLDAFNNGLSHIIEAFKDEECASHITLTRGERSTFSELAADKL